MNMVRSSDVRYWSYCTPSCVTWRTKVLGISINTSRLLSVFPRIGLPLKRWFRMHSQELQTASHLFAKVTARNFPLYSDNAIHLTRHRSESQGSLERKASTVFSIIYCPSWSISSECPMEFFFDVSRRINNAKRNLQSHHSLWQLTHEAHMHYDTGVKELHDCFHVHSTKVWFDKIAGPKIVIWAFHDIYTWVYDPDRSTWVRDRVAKLFRWTP